jgi:hypothetical protein
MSPLYAHPAVRDRLIEFLGGGSLDRATAIYLTHTDGYNFDRARLRRPDELDRLLDAGTDIARSLADSESVLFHLDVDYVNFDSPVQAYLDPDRTFALQEPVAQTVEALLLGWGIRPLHLITGQGHHFIWSIARTSPSADLLDALGPAPELLDACEQRVPPTHRKSIDLRAHGVFAATALVMEYLAHRIKAAAGPVTEIPVEITAVHVGPTATGRREIISVDISEYGDPLHTRSLRMPFTRYCKPSFLGLTQRVDSAPGLPTIYSLPLHEIDSRQAVKFRTVDAEVCALAQRASVRIPIQEAGTARLLHDYLTSALRRFHLHYYAEHHDAAGRWAQTYDRTPLEPLPACVRHLATWPNDLLLKPAGMQLTTRCLLAAGWHPRHIAGFIRSKFENPAYHWGVDWSDYAPALRADFYTRLFAGQIAVGLDQLGDLNCTSNRAKGFCFPPAHGSCDLEPCRQSLLAPSLP